MSAPPFKVKATYDYSSPHDDDLGFSEGQIITVTEEEDADWYIGEYADASGATKSGLFPRNFVERYEPAPPPRPSRSTRPKAAEPVAEPQQSEPVREASPPRVEGEKPREVITSPPVASDPAPAPTQRQAVPVAAPSQPVSDNPPVPENTKPKAGVKSPPPVAEKSSSFKDRIAAFNKPAAAPVAPFKPSGLGSGGFIKKPFVAPPPSRDAYVPPPKEAAQPQKIYRRDEDPEIAERRAQDQEAAEKAGLASSGDHEDEDAPKAVSLKERIALLQKQQAEQAARRSEASTKEKPKKPVKKRSESSHVEQTPEMEEPAPRSSVDSERIEQPAPRSRPDAPDVGLGLGFSDGNEADQSAGGETTEPEAISTEVDEERTIQRTGSNLPEDEQDDESEEEVDEETKHQMALRERMAKLSGGMGMPGMFGPPGGMPMMGMGAAAPSRKKKSEPVPESPSDELPTPLAAPRIPVLPQLSRNMSSESADEQRRSNDGNAPPPLPRSAPSADKSKPIAIDSPSAGSETDDELPGTSQTQIADLSASASSPPPLQNAPAIPRRQESISKRPTEQAYDSSPSIQPRQFSDKRHSQSSAKSPEVLASRLPPPIPSVASPPRPPQEFLHRQLSKTGIEGESEYEGDYDTDIASSAKHKDALKAHVREPSLDDSIQADEPRSPPQVPSSPPTSRAPVQRPVPPPPPTQAPRTSVDGPRGAPPLPPVPRDLPSPQDDDYDPYNYKGLPSSLPRPSSNAPPLPIGMPPPNHAVPPPIPQSAPRPPPPAGAPPPPIPSRTIESEESSDDEPLQASQSSLPPQQPPPIIQPRHAAQPPPPPSDPPAPTTKSARSSVDADRSAPPRRSTDQHRLPTNHEYIASDVDLGQSSTWWAQPDAPPPVFQNRKDLFFEIEETTASKRGNKTTVNKDIYVLFQDYSQTVITVRFDAKNPSDATLEQRHEAPPQKLRQDQLEDAHSKHGAKIAEVVGSLTNTTVGDGTPQALVLELLKPLKNALAPVGTRAYGALVYANLANATVQQFDEIRPGDIVSFRNAKFQGKHSGVMHSKYTLEAGKPDHVGVVVEWDGTKKKIRAVEQGREGKKSKPESFRLGDLRSGEVRVWRVMERAWIGWDNSD